VVVATPGRMLDILRRGKLDLSQIRTVVFDEADEMLHMGFRDELDGILAYTPEEKNTWLFSATMPDEIRAMTGRYMKEPVEVTIGRRNEGSANVTHHYYMVQAKERYLALKRIIDYYPEIYSIVFCRTRRETQEVAEKLIRDGYNADALHGDLSQAQRDNAMSRFRLKNLQLLVATDVAARGLDVNNLTHVLNYNLPDDVEQYTHRSGRTGRASATGISISLITVREKSRIKEIEKVIHKSFELKQLPSGEEICGKQVLYQAERMLGVDLAAEELETYLPAIYDKLQPLSKEELIQRFVALEFNRFLNYYRNAPEVRDMSVDAPRGKRSDERGDRSDFARLFINLGHMDGVKPQNIIGLLNDYVKDRDMRVGRIDLRKTCSFVEIPASYAELAVQALGGAVYRDRKVFAEVAKGKDKERGERTERTEKPERPERKGRAPKKDWMAFIEGGAWDKSEADTAAKPRGKAKAQKAWNKDAWGENPWESGAWRSEDRGRGARKGGARRAQKAVEKARGARKGKGKKK
ncbi:MAG: DEAD/DEAH box helicase, partial [Bacteroidales bacterium]|nr:DEAD/DEAH box helicase [Bacteroidales bacterium]